MLLKCYKNYPLNMSGERCGINLLNFLLLRPLPGLHRNVSNLPKPVIYSKLSDGKSSILLQKLMAVSMI